MSCPQESLSVRQLRQIAHDLDEIKRQVGEIANLMAAGLGEGDARTFRAREVVGALQRLEWAINRSKEAPRHLSASA